MKRILTKQSKTLIQLLIGIGIWGVLIQIGGLLLSADKIHFSIGLWVGILLAGGMAFHMQKSLETALDMDEKGAAGHIRKTYAARMAVVLIVLVILIYFGIGNVIACFLGLFSLKAAAYFQLYFNK